MRFLRMRPAVWAMISCSFSSLTRNVAFGSSSVTTPGNSKSSSFAIRSPAFWKQRGRIAPPRRREPSGITPIRQPLTMGGSLVAPTARRKALPDPFQQLITHLPIRVHPLLAAAFDGGRIRGRPIFDSGGKRAGQFTSLLVCLGRKGDDLAEIQ